MVGKFTSLDVVANDASDQILKKTLDPLRLVKKRVGVNTFDTHAPDHEEIVQLPEVNWTDMRIVNGLIHDLRRLLHQGLETREISGGEVFNPGIH